jgi:hypothetical protein
MMIEFLSIDMICMTSEAMLALSSFNAASTTEEDDGMTTWDGWWRKQF